MKGFGGSGGVVVLDGDFSSSFATAYGGLSSHTVGIDGCGNGAAGTIWNRKTEKLLVDNNGQKTRSVTNLKAKERSAKYAGKFMVGKTFIVRGGSYALVNMETNSAEVAFVVPEYEMWQGSKTMFNPTSGGKLTVYYEDEFFVHKNS